MAVVAQQVLEAPQILENKRARMKLDDFDRALFVYGCLLLVVSCLEHCEPSNVNRQPLTVNC